MRLQVQFCVEVKRKCLRKTQNLNRFDFQLNIAVLFVGNNVFLRALVDHPDGLNRAFSAGIFRSFNRRTTRKHNSLHRAGHVAEVEEDHFTLVASHGDPAFDKHGLTDVFAQIFDKYTFVHIVTPTFVRTSLIFFSACSRALSPPPFSICFTSASLTLARFSRIGPTTPSMSSMSASLSALYLPLFSL